jgi:hypothetical protein
VARYGLAEESVLFAVNMASFSKSRGVISSITVVPVDRKSK